MIKRLLPLMGIALLVNIPGQPAEAHRLPMAAAIRLDSIKMFTPAIGWAVAAGGVVVRTTNGGRVWSQALVCRTGHEVAASFLSPSVARIALANAKSPFDNAISIYRTSNGGRTWASTHLKVRGEVGPGSRITFADPNHGWLLVNRGVAAGSNPYVLVRTSDGGATWSILARTDHPNYGHGVIPPCDCTTAVTFKTPRVGWATGTGFAVPNPVWLYLSHDGGRSWRRQGLTVPSGYQVVLETMRPQFFSSRAGILPAQLMSKRTYNGFVAYMTANAGASWSATSPIVIPMGQGYSLTTSFVDQEHGWVASGRTLARTADAGTHWTFLHESLPFTKVTQIDFISPKVGFALSAASHGFPLLKTSNGGRSWQELIPIAVARRMGPIC